MKKSIITFFLIALFFNIIQAADRRIVVDSLNINNGQLAIDFHAEGILTEKVKQGLRRGLTSTIEYQVQIWEDKTGWINHLVAETEFTIKVFFDNWEKKYIVLTRHEKRLTSSLETVREKCSQISEVFICPISKLSAKKAYYVTIKAILRPLSVQNYREIKNWLSGEAKHFNLENLDDTENQEKKFKGGLLKMFLALTGFGDRVISGKSDNFGISENEIIWKED